jgi:hypothetical protein
MRIIVFNVAAGLCLTACNNASPGNDAVSSNAAAPSAEAAMPPTANAAPPMPSAGPAAGRPTLTREYLVGNWAEENCAEPDVKLNADGTTEGGRWELRGSQLIRITADGEDPPLDVEAVDADHFQISFAGLPPQAMQRCA